MELLLAFVAGLLTLLNPCVLPVLPIVLAASLQADRRGPLALACGLSLSFVLLGLFVIVLGASVGIDQQMMTTAGAVLMIGFGLVMLVPQLNERFALVTAGFAGNVDGRMHDVDSAGLGGQFLGGAMLGAVWSPCIGPTLGGAISLASRGQDIFWAGAVMAAFALGISSIMLALAYGAREVIVKRQRALRRLTGKAKPIMGITFLCVGLGIIFGLDRWLEGWLLDLLPEWLQDFTVSI
ncbi:MAG: cytochrome c biogenesis CcdA family protein [Proteobacteria bacterium]|nr:cytochrome c biogenesis CcdA family protein [Pseudomonadota bacterium]